MPAGGSAGEPPVRIYWLNLVSNSAFFYFLGFLALGILPLWGHAVLHFARYFEICELDLARFLGP